MDFERRFVRHESSPVVIGVDFGKMADPTAICVAEVLKVPRPGLKPEYRFEVRHMERMLLSTNYLEVGQRVAEVVDSLNGRQPFQGVPYRPCSQSGGAGADASAAHPSRAPPIRVSSMGLCGDCLGPPRAPARAHATAW